MDAHPIFYSAIILIYLFPIVLASICPAGTYVNGEKCEPCSFGEYNPKPGNLTGCLSCVAGTFSLFGATSCTPCAPGTYSQGRSYECISCKPGFGLSDYSTECVVCENLFYNDGTFRYCQRCPSGTFSKAEPSTTCKACPPGTYIDTRYVSSGRGRGPSCFACPKMSYSDKRGTRQCNLCPLGMFTNTTGNTVCMPCPAGTYRGLVKSLQCKPCPERMTSLGIAPAACKHETRGCPAGTIEDEKGECRACMPGERVDYATKRCVRCADTEVSGGGATSYCIKCGRNKVPASDATVYERSLCECKLGYGTEKDGSCKPCRVGTYGTGIPDGTVRVTLKRRYSYQSTYCDRCLKGTYSDIRGATQCKLCKRGTYTNDFYTGSAVCEKCLEGSETDEDEAHFSDERHINNAYGLCFSPIGPCDIGQVERGDQCVTVSCFRGQGVRLNGVLKCISCRRDQYYDLQKGNCEQCPKGSGNLPHLGRTSCIKCGKNEVFIGRRCQCKNNFERVNGVCTRCRKGLVSSYGKCRKCVVGVAIRNKWGITECKNCRGNTYLANPGDLKCTECPEGYKRSVDVLGRKTEGCEPVGAYGNSIDPKTISFPEEFFAFAPYRM